MKKWILISIIFLLWAVICYKTYVGGTYLLGWDNLAPELGFGINISRALSSAWQEYQGVGLLGGMGHAADLTRQILMWIASFVIPTSLLRWGWTLLMLLVGSLGIYVLGVFLFESSFVALVGAIFYLLNPVAIQVFNVPFETFTSFYGFVPWMIYDSLKYLRDGKRVTLVKLLVILLLGMSAFVVQTMFIVFAIVLGIFSVEYLIRHRDLKRVLKLWGVVVSVNLFWLLPILLFGITSSSVNVNAKMNLLATEEVELMNVAYGQMTEVAKLNGWWLQNTDVASDGHMILLMQNWTEWLGNKSVGVVGSVIFVLTAVGLLVMFRKDQKNNLKWSWIILLLLILTMLARRVEIFSKIYDYISQNVPLFGQMFRASYTKWSMPLMLAMSVGLMSIVGLFSKKFKIIGWIIGLMVVAMTTYTVLPVFKDGIVGERMKVTFPNEYLNLFKYFRSAEMGRIAKLPTNSLWGWNYNDWGYRGSGFLWYGIEQPILDRAFDVWSPYNETFYNEFSTALYGDDKEVLVKVLQKYDVRYVLLDESVIAPGQSVEILRIPETKQIMTDLGAKEVFHENFLTVWDISAQNLDVRRQTIVGDKFISAPSTYTSLQGDTLKTRNDVIYNDIGTYVEGEGVVYPFAGMMREEIKNVEYGDGVTYLTFDLANMRASHVSPLQITIPGWKVGDIVRIEYLENEPLPAYKINGEDGPRFLGKEKPEEGKSYIVARVSEGEEWSEYLREQKFEIRNEKLEIEVAGEPQIYDFGTQGRGTVGNCDVLKRGTANKFSNQKFSNSQMESQATIYVADNRGAACDYVTMSELDTRLSYLMRMQGENKEGRSLKFFLYNTGLKRNDIESLLSVRRTASSIRQNKFDSTFSLLPWSWDGTYTLNVETRSFRQRAENVINPVEVRWFPLEQIARARLVSQNSEQEYRISNNLEITEVRKYGTWLYRVKVSADAEAMADEGGLIKLSQGYDEGWMALESFDFAQDLRHVKVDGWANGWIVPGSGVATIFYWPQLLEYLGFALLGVTVLGLIFVKRSGSH